MKMSRETCCILTTAWIVTGILALVLHDVSLIDYPFIVTVAYGLLKLFGAFDA